MVLVVGARLLLPLTIPYFPLAGVVACLILDAIDQSIFQQFPKIPLDGYQSYDKALDVYYLSITYLSTLRNWTNQRAFRMSQFLLYYRLVGVVAFELSQLRAILFIFPNTFEYFFIFYEAVRLRWDPRRMGIWTVVVSTALIWVFIKLPQEWWIHIAQLDMTDFIKETLFGVSKDASWAAAIGNRPWVILVAIAVFSAIGLIGYWIVTRKAPPADHGPSLRADPLPPALRGGELYRLARADAPFFGWPLLEKIALMTLLTIIFVSMLPDLEARIWQIALFVTVFVALNTALTHLMARRGRSWRSVAVEFAAMIVVNFGIMVAIEAVERLFDLRESSPLGVTLFFVFLFTVILVMYDRYRTVYAARRALLKTAGAGAVAPSAPAPAPAPAR